MKVRIFTLGCKVNQFESNAIIAEMEKKGFSTVGEEEKAEITIINSCAVTAASEQKAVKLMNRIRREDPSTIIVLTGCMAQTQDENSKRLSQADIIVGNKRKADVVPAVCRR